MRDVGLKKFVFVLFAFVVFANRADAMEAFDFEDPHVYMEKYLPKKQPSEEDEAKKILQEQCRDELKELKLPLNMEGFVKQIKKGDAKLVRLYLDAGIDPNLTFYTDYPIYFAVRSNNVEVTRILIENGAKTNIGFDSPLYFAVKKKNLPMVQLLLKNGANPNHTDFVSGFSVLYFAVDKKLYDIARELIASGAKIDGASKRLIENRKLYDLLED